VPGMVSAVVADWFVLRLRGNIADMRGSRAAMFIFIARTLNCFGQAELPESDDYESFEVEPPALLENRDPGPGQSPASSATRRDPAELEKLVERAKRAAADAELLYKRGVLSKVEVEQRTLRIVKLQSDLENARLERATADLAAQRTRFEKGETTKDSVASAEHLVEALRETAEAAAGARERAEIAAAERNVQRQQKLAALGAARPGDVARAKQKLADLKAAKN
jgi:hypothetical protein